MSSRSSYSQKKKKEALRRLSQGGPRPARTGRPTIPDDSHRHGKSTRSVRRKRDSMEDEEHHSGRGNFSGRRVIATDSPSSGTHLVIQANLGGRSPDTDVPDTDPNIPRRVVTSQTTSQLQIKGQLLFGTTSELSPGSASDGALAGAGVSGGMFGASQRSSNEPGASEAGKRIQGLPARKSLFQTESNNPFSERPLFESASVFQTANKGTDSAGSMFGQAFTKDSLAERPQEVPSPHSPAEVPGSLFKSKEAAPGLDSVTRNLFGKAPATTTDPYPSLFIKPSAKAEQIFTSPTKVRFGRQVPVEPETKPRSKILFGKVVEPSSNRERNDASSKRQLSPGRSEAASKRTLTSFDDPFSSASSDITDLETFGAHATKKESKQKKPVIKRLGLFEKAMAEASGKGLDSVREADQRGSRVSIRESHQSRSRSPDRKRRSPERPREDERKKSREESKPAQRSSSGSSSRHFASQDEIKNLQAIIIKGVPPKVNSRPYLKDFFSKYGRVTRVYTNPAKNSATVFFADHDSAANAKKKVRVLSHGTKPVAIFWRQGDQGSKSENRQSQDDQHVPSSRRDENRQPVVRQSLAPYNRKVESKVNPEDGSSTVSSASHPKMSTLSVPAHLLSKQVGLTAQERYDILEDRDKIIRQGLKKKSNLVIPEAIKGTCPDMCPEKERYMRVVQRRLHPFEVLQGTSDKVNHETAVKEYSRSSADQEEPLPHEMRPAPVLTMAMNYLMRYVMNVGRDGHWEEWFDFLWSRTRGIRKDIAQQDLCDLTAIDLMGKCARFHIFCSHRLCEEDLSTIDPKINNENLTKCMQSLKQFYHDLASQGVVCPYEAEFRAYDVLLNLNDRDILRQVQQYRVEVRSSEAVKFALKAFSAVSSNNYVKFFKLVRSTTYLNACIMHRYFMQVRNLALDVMNTAYTVSQRGSRFSLVKITTTLAFDHQSQALEFCQSHNLAVEDDMIHFSRAAFQHPDIAPSPERSLRIIQAKNTMAIGEVVNGGPLPPDVTHKPSTSFDENGHYKGYTAVTTETAATESKDVAVERPKLAEGIVKPADNQILTTAPTSDPTVFQQTTVKVLFPSTEIKEVARGLFLEVIDEMVRDLSSSFLGWLRLIQVGSVEILHETIERAVIPSIREIAQGIVEQEQHRHQEAQIAEMNQRRLELEQQAREEERQRRDMMERRERLEQTAAKVTEETVDDVVQEESKVISTDEIRAVQQQLKTERTERCTSQLHHEVIEATLTSQCRQVAAEVLQSETELRDQRLVESERAVLMAQTARYLHRWYRVYTKRMHLRRTLLTFPAAPPNQTAAEQLKVLWAGRGERSEVSKGHRQRDVTLESPFSIVTGRESIARSILKVHYLKNLRQQQAWSPLDLPRMLRDAFHCHHASGPAGDGQRHHYWKLVASLPSAGSHGGEVLGDWLRAKLQRGRISEGIREKQLEDNSQVETLSLYSCKVAHISPSQTCTLSICTKVTAGSLDPTPHHRRQTRHQLLGTSGILFGLDPASRDQNYWQRAKFRLDSVLQAKPRSPPPPLVIALLDWPATEHARSVCEERLGLRRMSQMGLVSSYLCMLLTGDVEDPANSQQLGESLEWLASHCPQPPQLSEDSLKGYLDTGMTEFFSLPLHEDARTRWDATLPEQGCHHVIDLYNATVRHLASVASSGTLTSLSWPPTEFTKTTNPTELPDPDWNASDSMQLLRSRILSLTLPALPLIHQDDGWQHVCDVCHEYLSSMPGNHRSKAPLFARVQRLLEKCRRSFEDTCYLSFDAPGCEPMAGHVPWTRIIQECIDYVMSTVQSRDHADGDDDKPMNVYYIQSEFDGFQIPQTWKNAVQTTTKDSFLQPPRFASQVAAVVQQKQTEFMKRQLEATMIDMKENRKPPVIVLEREPACVADAKESAQAVKSVLSSAKEESKMFDDLLQQWLQGTTETVSQDGTPETDSPPKSCKSPPHLEQSLQDLTLAMESERRASRLAELRLASLLSL